ncbi:serine/threonine protein kinase [Xanthomonas sacchari]|uniref:serine/threonine-protein kinase n=1 Tax=Xanthomonas sacchari TaxID=56458 RepID=UPI0027864450|nr:serine/threonine-protein kinase [Xanthomonas sacchari]MDQ1091814.1 serine/threonine protein kinase [Xanthomonas sacchari]
MHDLHAEALKLFDTFVALPPTRRATALQRLRTAHPALAAVLDGLLDADAASSPLDLPLPTALAGAAAEIEPDRRLQTHLGPWRIVQVLGEGGMGTVYEARRSDGHYTQTVALKCLRIAAVSPAVADALRHERDTVAQLDHPGIAALLDGGIDRDGHPWFAMQKVDGQPIDQWCDAHRLSPRERVRLLLQVCDAVAYAHRLGIVHQDIKPSNLLVAEDGRPRLLDFGLARRLQSDRKLIAISHGYAAPEALRDARPARTLDIYALGVVLYRLLCGSGPLPPAPLGGAALAAAPQPRRPSALAAGTDAASAQARGLSRPRALAAAIGADLDGIALRCVAIAPEQRYPSVEDLQADLQRWLAHRPVTAAPTSRPHRIHLFLRRNALAATLCSIAVAALLIGGGMAALQLQRARQELRSVAALDRLFERTLGSTTLSGLGETPLTPQRLLAETEGRLRDPAFPHTPTSRALGLAALARSYDVIGNTAHAARLAAEAVALRPDDARIAAILASLQNQQADYARAERTALHGLQQVDDTVEQDAERLRLRATLIAARARARWGQADQDQATALLEQALAQLPNGGADNTVLRADLLTLRGYWRLQKYRMAEAEQDLQHAIALSQPLAPATADDARHFLVRTLGLLDRPSEAHALAVTLLASRRRMYGEKHPQTARALVSYAESLIYLSDLKQALVYTDKARAIFHASVGDDHPDMAEALRFSSYARTGTGDLAGAIGQAREALRIHLRAHGPHHELTLKAKSNLAGELIYFGQYVPEQRKAYDDEALALFREVIAEGTRQRLPMPAIRLTYAFGLVISEHPQEAEQQLLLADHEIVTYLGRQHSYLSQTQYSLGLLYVQLNRDGDAERVFQALVDGMGDPAQASYMRTMNAFGALDGLGDIAQRGGRTGQARRYWQRALELGSRIYGPRDNTLVAVKRKLAAAG